MRRTSRVAAGMVLSLAGLGAGCTLVAGVGDYAVGDAGGQRTGDARVDASRDGHATSSHDAARDGDAAPTRDATRDATQDADANATTGDGSSTPDAGGSAPCGILDAGAPIDLCMGTVAPAQLTPFTSSSPVIAIVADGMSVYWSDGDSIWSCATGGCTGGPMTIFSAPPVQDDAGVLHHAVSDLAVDSMSLYWSGIPDGLSMSNVTSCLKSGCGGTLIVPYGAGMTPATGVASDGTNVFWTDGAGVHTCTMGGCSGASPATVASGNPASGPIALGSKYVYWVDAMLGHLVHTAKGDTVISETAPPGPEVSASFVPTATGNTQLVTTPDGVYWASPFALNFCPSSALGSVAACTGGATRVGPIFATPPSTCSARSTTNIPITTDGTNIYYVAPTAAESACPAHAALVKCTPQDDCTVLYSGLPTSASVVAADIRNVYWADTSGATPAVMLIPHS